MTNQHAELIRNYLTDEQRKNPAVQNAFSLLTLLHLKQSVEAIEKAQDVNTNNELVPYLEKIKEETRNIADQLEEYLFENPNAN